MRARMGSEAEESTDPEAAPGSVDTAGSPRMAPPIDPACIAGADATRRDQCSNSGAVGAAAQTGGSGGRAARTARGPDTDYRVTRFSPIRWLTPTAERRDGRAGGRDTSSTRRITP